MKPDNTTQPRVKAPGFHARGLADPARPTRYLLSRTGLLHLRADFGVVEEDGLSATAAECGVEGLSVYVTPIIPAEGRPLCRRCLRGVQ